MVDLRFLLAVGLDHPNAREVLLSGRRQFREFLLDSHRSYVEQIGQPVNDRGHNRQRDQSVQCQLWRQVDHYAQGDGQFDDRIAYVHYTGTDHLANRLEIVGHAGHDITGAGVMIESGRHLQKMREQFAPEVVLDKTGHPDYRPPHGEAKHARQDGQDKGDNHVAQNNRIRLPGFEGVKDELGDVGNDQNQDIGL